MSDASPTVVATPPRARSRLSNGNALLAGVDGRSTWARRLRDLLQVHLADLGGADNVSEGERAILRRACTLVVECERMESEFALAGSASADGLALYVTVSNSLRRLLEALGLERRARNVTPSLSAYLSERSRQAETASDAEEAAR